jgi:serine-type D-Ala-D-Ala carboxypeptidase/endopeptidase (penicillin-binding protein 4)
MNPKLKWSRLAGAAILVLLFQTGVRAQLSSQIQYAIDRSQASHAFWVVQVRDSSGGLLEDLNGDKLIRPASNLKLVTSGAFLENLGPEYRFTTTLHGRGEQVGDRWRGDLIIKGSGDPSINGDFYNDPLFLFEKWYQVLDSLGIRQIDGNIVAYDGLFDDIPYPRGWEWDDLSYYYAPEINALSFNSNVVNLEVIADGEVGGTPQIQWYPFNTPYVDFVNEQVITPRSTRYNESYRRILGTNTILLRSTLPQGYYETEPLSVMAPSLYFIDTFARYLGQSGIPVRGQLLTDSDYYSWSDQGLTLFDTHTSEPLYTMVEWMNRESDNFFTEMLTKTLAAELYNTQGTTELGLNVIREFMHSTGFDTLSVMLRDASGMAPANLVKASDLNQYLVNIQKKPWFSYLYESLSISGVDGTLGNRFREGELTENFYGKTGFSSGVRSLSGYLKAKSGQWLTVTIITNNYTVRTANVDWVHERILEYLYNGY